MSLIHEALKRAETDKVRTSSPYFENLTVLTPSEDDTPPPPLPPVCEPRRRKGPLLGILGILMIAVGMGGAGLVWYRSSGRSGPDQAGAADRPARPAGHVTASAAAEQPAPKPAVAPPSRPTEPAGDVRPALARTLDETQYYKPFCEPTAASRPTATSRPAAGPQAKPTTEPATAVAAGPASEPADDGGEDERPSSARTRPAAPPSPAARRTSAASVASLQKKLRLSAIMRGPEGNAALINGDLLREGQTILGAKILSIGRHQVELESDGQRFTIRM